MGVSMDTEIKKEGDTLFVNLSGRLDTLRAMELDDQLNAAADGVKDIVFDLDGLTYIASAGLRLLFWAQEYTGEHGGTSIVKHVSDEVNEIFAMTGFRDIITIE